MQGMTIIVSVNSRHQGSNPPHDDDGNSYITVVVNGGWISMTETYSR
jgi:hypothetical protein